MINNRLQAGKVVSLLVLLMLFAGCQKSVVPVSDKNRFDSRVNALVAQPWILPQHARGYRTGRRDFKKRHGRQPVFPAG